jgi:hypothetical protein
MPLRSRRSVGISPAGEGLQARGAAVSRLAINPPGIERLLAALVATRLAPLLSWEPLRQTLAHVHGRRTANHDAPVALRVDVTKDKRSSSATLTAPVQADATAVGAAGLLRSLVAGEVDKPGAWMPEQVVDPARYFSRLAESGLTIEVAPQPLGQ